MSVQAWPENRTPGPLFRGSNRGAGRASISSGWPLWPRLALSDLVGRFCEGCMY